MAKQRSLTDEPTFNGHPILTDKIKGLKCDKKILKKIDATLQHAIQDHDMDRIFAYQSIVRFPKDCTIPDSEKNGLFRKYQSKVIKNLDRQGLDPHYFAVREYSKEKRCHIHVYYLVNERLTRSCHDHIAKKDELWKNTLGKHGKKGLIDDCTKNRDGKRQKNGHTIKVNSPDFEKQKDEFFKHASYYAKENTKSKNDGKRELFSSRLNHEIKKKK